MKRRTIGEYYNLLFVDRSQHGLIQLFRYIFVGGFSALVDIGSLYMFTSHLHIHYLVSAFLAFILGTIVNYFLSILWVFESSDKKKTEFLLFSLIGFGGLLLNGLILWVTVEQFHIFYLIGKLISVAIVVFWSFSLRRLLFAKLAGGAMTQ